MKRKDERIWRDIQSYYDKHNRQIPDVAKEEMISRYKFVDFSIKILRIFMTGLLASLVYMLGSQLYSVRFWAYELNTVIKRSIFTLITVSLLFSLVWMVSKIIVEDLYYFQYMDIEGWRTNRNREE